MAQVFSFRLPDHIEQLVLAQAEPGEKPGATARRLIMAMFGDVTSGDSEGDVNAVNVAVNRFVDKDSVDTLIRESITKTLAELHQPTRGEMEQQVTELQTRLDQVMEKVRSGKLVA